jgi:hypothetical protein
MEKRQRRILSLPSFISAISASLRVPVTPAAAERQERSDRVSEEASYLLHYHYLLTPGSCISSCHISTFADTHTNANIVSQYTLR